MAIDILNLRFCSFGNCSGPKSHGYQSRLVIFIDKLLKSALVRRLGMFNLDEHIFLGGVQ